MGNLIVLSCGHNGSFSSDEMNLYQMHLQEAGFIENLESYNDLSNN